MDETTVLFDRLRALVNQMGPLSLESSWATMKHEFWRSDANQADRVRYDALKIELAETVLELDTSLPDVPINDDISAEFEGDSWSFGSELQVLAPRKITRGFIVPVRRIPSGVPLTLKVFAIIRIGGERDWLERENHNFGMHYHYVLADKRRTSTMICWDTRWTSSVDSDPKGVLDRPLFHQLHNDKKNVPASPTTWGDKKRQSVRKACVPDLKRQNVTDFLCAEQGAASVWPRGLAVSTRP